MKGNTLSAPKPVIEVLTHRASRDALRHCPVHRSFALRMLRLTSSLTQHARSALRTSPGRVADAACFGGSCFKQRSSRNHPKHPVKVWTKPPEPACHVQRPLLSFLPVIFSLPDHGTSKAAREATASIELVFCYCMLSPEEPRGLGEALWGTCFLGGTVMAIRMQFHLARSARSRPSMQGGSTSCRC